MTNLNLDPDNSKLEGRAPVGIHVSTWAFKLFKIGPQYLNSLNSSK